MKRFVAVLLLIVFILPASVAGAAGTLETGAKGDEVKKIQTRLIELGFLKGKADGDYGKNTETAVKDFQTYLKQQGYSVTANGVASTKTQAMLFDDQYAQRRLTLQKGDANPLVTNLQTRLIELGFLIGYADGSFGGKTEDALKAFQEMLVESGVSDIRINGKADAATRKMLKADLSGYDIKTPVFFDEAKPLSLDDCYLYAQACMLIDAKTGEVLYSKNANQKMYPASTTKIMTLLLALERGKLDEIVTVPASAGEVPVDSSRVPIQVGEKMPYRDLLYGLMIRSGNDAANAVATLTSGSVDAFVKAMNKKAKEIGLTNTNYVNPHGYHDENHYTTAQDMAALARYALKNEQFKKIVSARSYTMAATNLRKELILKNSYQLLDPSSKYYDPRAYGIKTGYTSAASYCYVGGAEKDGVSLIAVILNSSGSKVNKWTDAKRLFNYGFAMKDAA